MANKIVIERLEFQGRCGVTPEERHHPQRLAIDLELEVDTAPAASSDHIADTVDYARVIDRIASLGAAENCALLETFAERLLAALFAEYPIERAKLWLRKLEPPLSHMTGSVGIKVDRVRAAYPNHSQDPAPSRFLTQYVGRLPKGRALDVASGSGRHALYLASLGFEVEAIDRDAEALFKLATTAKHRNLPNLTVKTVDLERATDERQEFPANSYDVIVVSFYLHRPLFPWIVEALRPNGVLLYETFTIENYFRHRHPRRWEFCLAHNELLRLTSALRVLSYDEGEHDAGSGRGSVFTAQLLAQKAGPTHSTSESP
ncbi:MAG: dihydroneopterin aldolase [Nitrospira sp. CR1.3]|nr:dihydroneopterin aldolase [Nitrospira sp. CR1.3]